MVIRQEIENPLVLDRVYRSPEKVYPMVKPDPTCSCGCGKTVVDGFKYDDEYFQTEACVVRMMLSEGWLKRVG